MRVIDFLFQTAALTRKVNTAIGKYSCGADFVLQNGMRFRFAKLPENIKRGMPRQCFYNAYKAVLDNSGLTYCEGFACGAGSIPTLHAWCVDKRGRIVDTTWETGDEYIGVPLSASFVLGRFAEAGYSISMIDDYEKRWPLLHSVDVEDVIAEDFKGRWTNRKRLTREQDTRFPPLTDEQVILSEEFNAARERASKFVREDPNAINSTREEVQAAVREFMAISNAVWVAFKPVVEEVEQKFGTDAVLEYLGKNVPDCIGRIAKTSWIRHQKDSEKTPSGAI